MHQGLWQHPKVAQNAPVTIVIVILLTKAKVAKASPKASSRSPPPEPPVLVSYIFLPPPPAKGVGIVQELGTAWAQPQPTKEGKAKCYDKKLAAWMINGVPGTPIYGTSHYSPLSYGMKCGLDYFNYTILYHIHLWNNPYS